MARSGLYKSDVKKARDALIAQKINPSVDALRVALGNTGSKTTIHKYLKELEADDGSVGRNVSISEALQDLVARLAMQLQEEADVQIAAIQAQSLDKEREHTKILSTLKSEMATLTVQLQRSELAVQQEQDAHALTRKTSQNEMITRHKLAEQIVGLKERLAENEAHRQSIEEKHQHARDALEHYRQSVKEQRDQDQRRHEQQVQQVQAEMRQLQQSLIVKQEDLTRINQEAARLVADLSHAQKMLYDQQTAGRQLEQKLETQQSVQQRSNMLEVQMAEQAAHSQMMKEQLSQEVAKSDRLSRDSRDLELALAATQAKLEAQDGMMADLRNYLDQVGGKNIQGAPTFT